MKNVLTAMMLLAIATTGFAVPQQINFQAYLTRSDGTPLDTTIAIRFSIYDVAVGGSPIWNQTQLQVTVSGGILNTPIGMNGTLPDLFAVPRFLGVRVGGDDEMTPRHQIISTAHAYRVGTLDGASGGAISSDVIVAGKANIGSGNVNSGNYAFVAGLNDTASGGVSTVCGGQNNVAAGFKSAVGGGADNHVSGNFSVTSGGSNNVVDGIVCCIGGGQNNEIPLTGYSSTVAGGSNNRAGGGWASVPGGYRNRADGEYSLAAGDSATVTGDHSFVLGSRIACAAENAFVWSDGAGPVLSIGSSNTFSVKATNGTRIWTSSGLTSGVTIGAGGNAWVAVCDSTKKRNIRLVDTRDILTRFSTLPLKRWEYKSEEAGVEHVGPMAQDFWNAFHLGSDSLGISSVDADGVMMAAMQELAKRCERNERKILELETENSAFQRQIQVLLARDEQTRLKEEK